MRSEYDTFSKLGRGEASKSISRTRRLECSIDRKISHLGCASCLYMSAPGGDDYSASSAVYTAVAAPRWLGEGVILCQPQHPLTMTPRNAKGDETGCV